MNRAPDKKAALGRLSGDVDALRELAGIFLRQCPALMTEIREAIERDSPSDLATAAHTLKGSAGFVGADWAAAAALELEHLARSGSLAGATDLMVGLEQAVAVSLPVLQDWTDNWYSTHTP